MFELNKVLVVTDANLFHGPGLTQASALCKRGGAKLTIGLFDQHPRLGVMGLMNPPQSLMIEQQMAAQAEGCLEDLRRSVSQNEGIPADALVQWEQAASEAILKNVIDGGFDLIIKDMDPPSRLHRMFYTPTDWELLRRSPVPIWLAGKSRPRLPRKIMACVDPMHDQHGAGVLNTHLIQVAQATARLCDSGLQLFSVFSGLPPLLTAGHYPIPVSGASLSELYEDIRLLHRSQMEKLAASADIGDQDIKLGYGNPVDKIVEAVEEHGVELLVLGTMHRRGMDRMLIGSTAERVLGRINCDVLAVGPPPGAGVG